MVAAQAYKVHMHGKRAMHAHITACKFQVKRTARKSVRAAVERISLQTGKLTFLGGARVCELDRPLATDWSTKHPETLTPRVTMQCSSLCVGACV